MEREQRHSVGQEQLVQPPPSVERDSVFVVLLLLLLSSSSSLSSSSQSTIVVIIIIIIIINPHRYRSFSVLDDDAKKAVQVILAQAPKTEKPVQLYDMCMNTAAVNALGAAPLLPLLQALLSPLPSVEDSVALLHRRASSAFFSFYVDADPVDPTRYSLTMCRPPPTPSLSTDFLH